MIDGRNVPLQIYVFKVVNYVELLCLQRMIVAERKTVGVGNGKRRDEKTKHVLESHAL